MNSNRKIVVCPDSFKGSLSSREVAEVVARALKDCESSLNVVQLPLADGGEGTADILQNIFPVKINIETVDPLKRKLSSSFRCDTQRERALIESAMAIGLPLLTKNERNPLYTSTYGLGVMIKKAVTMGFQEIYISLGGSATNDAGMGMLEALGYKFFDKNDKILSGEGQNLRLLKRIEPPENVEAFQQPSFFAVCDVNNPLYGSNGASYNFALQKGADLKDLKILDEGLRKMEYTAILSGIAKEDDAFIPGAGAAGGLGYGLNVFLKAQYLNGINMILRALDFDKIIEGADLIITGEGKIDKQSLMGKVVSGVLKEADKKEIPVIALAGIIEDKELLLKSGIKEVLEIRNPEISIEENMEPSQALLNIRNQILLKYDMLKNYIH